MGWFGEFDQVVDAGGPDKVDDLGLPVYQVEFHLAVVAGQDLLVPVDEIEHNWVSDQHLAALGEAGPR